MVQALCGLTRATGDAAPLAEAKRLFESRDTYNFDQFFGALDGETMLNWPSPPMRSAAPATLPRGSPAHGAAA